VRLLGGWALILVGMAGCLMLRDRFDSGSWTLLCAGTLFATAKAATLGRLDGPMRRRLSGRGLLAYLGWPGLRPQPFLRDAAPTPEPRPPLAVTSLVNLTAGAALLWLVPLLLPTSTSALVRIGVGIAGFCLVLLFGVMDGWAALLRRGGVPVEKLWRNPPAASSLADFWGSRWNRIFSGFARDMIFLPLGRVAGARLASLAVFLFAGLLHEWAWSAAARGGYGGPTLYFVLQGLLVQAESTAAGRRLLRRHAAVGRLWTWLAVLIPLPLALHQPYLRGFVVPHLVALGVRGL
jgi:hypothetical protein